MLGNTAELAVGYIGISYCVQKRSLTVVNMTHNNNNRRTRFELFLCIGFIVKQHIFGGENNLFFECSAHFFDYQRCGIKVNCFIHGCHNTEKHKLFYYLGCRASHSLSKLSHRYLIGDKNVYFLFFLFFFLFAFEHILCGRFLLCSARFYTLLLLFFLLVYLLFLCSLFNIIGDKLFYLFIVYTVKINRVHTGINGSYLSRYLNNRIFNLFIFVLGCFGFLFLWLIHILVHRKIRNLILLCIVFKDYVQLILAERTHMIFVRHVIVMKNLYYFLTRNPKGL